MRFSAILNLICGVFLISISTNYFITGVSLGAWVSLIVGILNLVCYDRSLLTKEQRK